MVAVIFDMDGVIVDSERYWDAEQARILEETVESEQVTPDDLTGMNVMDQYVYLDDQYPINVGKNEYFQLYDEKAEAVYQEKSSLMDSFKELIGFLHEDGVPVAIASSSFRSWIQMVLDRFDLEDAFDAVVSAEDIDGQSKPSPDIYLYTAERIGADPAECVVIEDSKHGVEAAKNAGMRCIGFRTDINEGQDLSGADVIVNGPDELKAFVQARRYRELVGEQ